MLLETLEQRLLFAFVPNSAGEITITGTSSTTTPDQFQLTSASNFVYLTNLRTGVVEASTGPVTKVTVNLGAGNDYLRMTTVDGQFALPMKTVVNGSTGNDTIYGGHGADTLNGGDGNDKLVGSLGADLIVGNAGFDTADYAYSAAAVRVSLDNVANDGSTGEGDNVQTEAIVGGLGNDTLIGSSAGNVIDGGAGNDQIAGRGGNDTLTGGIGIDTIWGEDGGDFLFAKEGTADQVNDGPGTDSAQVDTSPVADVATAAAAPVISAAFLARFAAFEESQNPADLDFSFGDDLDGNESPDGIKSIGDLGYFSTVSQVLIQPVDIGDGFTEDRIVLVGTTYNDDFDQDFFVMRLLDDGSLDTSFGDPDPEGEDGFSRLGYARADFRFMGLGYGVRNDVAASAVLTPDGRIVVAGTSSDPNADTEGVNPTADFAIAKFTPDGTIDDSFGFFQGESSLRTGMVTFDFSEYYDDEFEYSDEAVEVLVSDGDGTDIYTVVGNSTTSNDGTEIAVVRFLGDSSIDPDFSPTRDGSEEDNSDTTAAGAVLDANGAIWVAAAEYAPVSFSAFVEANSFTTTVIYGFGGTGYVLATSSDPEFQMQGTAPTDIAIRDNRLVIVGETVNGGNSGMIATLDVTTIESDGTYYELSPFNLLEIANPTNIMFGTLLLRSVAIDPQGRAVVFGTDEDDSIDEDYFTMRFDIDFDELLGDDTFNVDKPYVSTNVLDNPFNSDDIGQAMAIASDGRIVVAGVSFQGEGVFPITVARYNGSGPGDEIAEVILEDEDVAALPFTYTNDDGEVGDEGTLPQYLIDLILIPEVDAAGILTVTGTEFGDYIKITRTEDEPGNAVIRVQINRDFYTYNALDITGIVVNALDGDDTVDTTEDGVTPTTVFGGAGNDSIVAGNGDDWLYGDASGDDVNLRTLFAAGALVGTPGDDTIIGGDGSDSIVGGGGNDILVGDFATLTYNTTTGALKTITSVNDDEGAADDITGGDQSDTIIGGAGGDVINALGGNDLVFGDFGKVDKTKSTATSFTSQFMTNTSPGGDDSISAGEGHDTVLGGQGNDTLLGEGGDDDLIGGHNVANGFDGSDAMDGGEGNDVLAGDNAVVVRRNDTLSRVARKLASSGMFNSVGCANVTTTSQANPNGSIGRDITLLNHTSSTSADQYGADYIAGGAGHDLIFGALGNDVIQGDSSISVAVSVTVPSVEAATDGDDYIEGNGGSDLLFGNLGQDDLIGGSSSLFGLTSTASRPDGADTIFGGAGTRTAINDPGDTSATGHARDADTILGDNGHIYKLVATSGGPKYLTFNYDNYSSTRIIPRAFDLYDYKPRNWATDLGGADLIQGEAGDDLVVAQSGNDVVFGNGQDDDLIGGSGSDRIYGGTGEDGILGDDGFIHTSRNGTTEPLFGVTTASVQKTLTLAGASTSSFEYVTGQLTKTARYYNFTQGGADIIYGGLGNDWIHGGAGDDGISGAESLEAFYNTSPVSSTNPLNYSSSLKKFAQFNPATPFVKIDGFFLNFLSLDESSSKINDGNDRIFGDNGNDWIVGGTNNDRMFGGLGDDLLNADDNLDTAGTDAAPFNDADFAFGGNGKDVLIANASNDRLFDWTSSAQNAFYVPFSPVGSVVNTSSSSAVKTFLKDLGKASGAYTVLKDAEGELGLGNG